MARSKIAITSLEKFNTSGAITADAVELSDGNYLDLAGINSNKLLIVFHGSTASMTATFKAGVFSDSGIGDLVVTVGATAIVAVVVETSRFKDSDGYILIDCAGATADGTIEAVELPN